MKNRINGYGGAICVTKDGQVGAEFSTEMMSWAYIKDDQLHYGINKNQHEVEDIPAKC